MFSPLNLFSSASNPIPCPALLENQLCPIPRCLFSHDVKPAPPPPAPPPLPEAVVTTVNNAPPVAVDNPEPPKPPPPLSATEKRLREIVEGKTQDVAVGRRQSKSPDQGGSTQLLTDDGPPTKRRASASTASIRPADTPEELASLSAWPTPAQSMGKKATAPKGGGVSLGEFYETQTPQPLKASPATSIIANKATAAGTSGTMKYTAAVRSLKRPASDSPGSSAAKTDPLKRPKTTTTTPTTKATASTEVPAKSTVRQALNPRLIARAPAPHGIRLKYLEVLQTEITRLSGNPKGEAATQKIIEKCLDLEEEVATKKRDIYRSAISNLCMRYKKATPEDYKKELQEEMAKAAPAPAAPKTRRAGLDNAKLPLDTGLAKPTEVTRLRDLVANPGVLKKHGYILIPPTEEEIEQARSGLETASGYENCERCNQRFQVFPGRRISDGSLTTGGTCNYHHGRKAGVRPTPGAISEQKWTCCSRVVGFDSGCEIAPTHVFKVSDPKRLALTLQFSHTPENPKIKHDRALALDCEMSYTSLGMELVRLTATAFPSGKIVIDALVKPYGVVLDFNSRFSGVTQEMFASAPRWKPTASYPDAVTTDLINPTLHMPPAQLGCFQSPEHARKALYYYIGPDTILIGHALENDLLHLRMCHAAIVDTVILFPHQRGLPARNKLKYVVERVLRREIQVDGGDSGLAGHDSAVDARCAAELARWKIREAEGKREV